MRISVLFFARFVLLVAVFAPTIAAQEKEPAQKEQLLPPPDRAPHLILAQNGPHAPVRALAFSPDGSTLYVGGFDKQVRRYQLVKGKFVVKDSLRVPIGPGNAGAINAIAVSPDGKWVAAAGRAPIRGENWSGGESGIGEDFRRFPTFQKRDAGVVYLFDTTNPNGGKVLRGQQAGVRSLAFATPSPTEGPILVTAGIEWNEKGEFFGTVRVFDVKKGEEIASRSDFPSSTIPPGLAAWATGANKDGLRVAVAWDAVDAASGEPRSSKLLIWDKPGTKLERATWEVEGLRISPMALRVDKDGNATELVTGGYEPSRKTGGVNTRSLATGAIRTTLLRDPAGKLLLPTAIAAFNMKDIGDATAVLVPSTSDLEGRRYEVRVLTPKGEGSIIRSGFHQQQPVLAASPDGKFVALAGFRDNRVEVYDTTALAANKPVVEKIAGGEPGFDKVAFLTDEKLWLGRGGDTLEKGGAILDLGAKARIVTPRGAKEELKLDTPAGIAMPEILEAKDKLPWRVVVTVEGTKKTISLPDGERVIAALFLPGKPAWNVKLGPIVAIARFHEHSQSVFITIYDAVKGTPIIHLDGPTLPVRSFAFSGSSPLLAAAGDDGTIAVWSLKDFTQVIPAIEGLLITEREGSVVITSVQPKSAADGKFKPGDVVESVTSAKGKEIAIKEPLDFVLAVRGFKDGDNVQVKVKNQAAVAVKVGVATGMRHPLFTLWVDPNAKDNQHDWIGWTAAGPYSTNGETAEARIGWLAATGDPLRPVSFAPASQYRKDNYKPDAIRKLLETADLKDLRPTRPAERPKIMATWHGITEERDGKRITRAKIDSLEITVSDPDNVLDYDRAALQWQVIDPDGTASEWKRESFSSGRAALDLSRHTWKRGGQRVRVRLLTGGDAPADIAVLHEITTAVGFIPPRPKLAIQIDGKPPAAGVEIITENEQVEISATVDAKESVEGAAVTISSSGSKPQEMRRNANGTFEPAKVKLLDKETTVILVSALNIGGTAADESDIVEVRVRKLPPKVVTPPTVILTVLSPHDVRTKSDDDYAVRADTVRVKATVTSEEPLTKFEWVIGDAKPEAGKLDPKTNSETREFKVPADKPLTVEVRTQSKNSSVATDRVKLVYDEPPEISVDDIKNARLTSPDLNLGGGLKVRGNRPFHVRVLVTSAVTKQIREFDATPDGSKTKWLSPITLFPGENWLGYTVKYNDARRELRREELIPVWYLRLPMIAAALPIDAGTKSVGDLTLAVLSRDAAPSELWVNDTRVRFRTLAKLPSLFRVPLWVMQANSVSVIQGEERLKQLAVAVVNLDGQSPRVNVNVLAQVAKPGLPPAIQLTYTGGVIAGLEPLGPFGDPNFRFQLKLTSETRLSRVEVWHGAGNDPTGNEVGKLTPVGIEMTATQQLRLRPGLNHVRVVAANDADELVRSFNVSYTPPPARVVIESIKELDGKPILISSGSVNELAVDKGIIDIEGRVEWYHPDEPVGRDENLSVVFVVNGVAHLPVKVPTVKSGKSRKFTGRVYLNAAGSRNQNETTKAQVKVELRSGGRPVPIPRELLSESQDSLTVSCKRPITKQRLHVVMIGVEVPESQRGPLVQRVIRAVGGEIPDDNPNFTEGRFKRENFDFAYLYSPRLGYTKSGDLNALLNAVRADITERSRRLNDEWVNDVIVVYYQGADWQEADGRWLLHSATTMSGAAGKNLGDYAIRLDSLPLMPGLPVAMIVVPNKEKVFRTLAVDLDYLRCAHGNPDASGQLSLVEKAVMTSRTLGDVAGYWKERVGQNATVIVALSDEASLRVFKVKEP